MIILHPVVAARWLLLPRAERGARKFHHMAPGHPERIVRDLTDTEEEFLGAACTELWPHDEYLAIDPRRPGAA